jgi:formylglycine-generating enzyme required for sulfatase activity
MNKINVYKFGGIEFVAVPKGRFLMGSVADDRDAAGNEKPQHTVDIPYDYFIGRYPITVEQYLEFARRTRHGTEDTFWWNKSSNHPVRFVSWNDAQTYCKWLNRLYHAELPGRLKFRLATEAEWEKAARGPFGLKWPWGNEFDPHKCNSFESKEGNITPVGAYSPDGDSPYGAADMAGNIWEWTQSLFKDYPYNAQDGRENLDDDSHRVRRGSSYTLNQNFARCTTRDWAQPNDEETTAGFRIVIGPT